MEMASVNGNAKSKSNNSNSNANANADAKTNGVKEKKGKKIIPIQVSKTKKPFFFYLNLAKKYIKQGNDVELCALGMAIPTVVIISEILKNNGWAFEKSITTSTVAAKEDKEGRGIPKAKLGILLGKAGDMDQSTVDASHGKNGAADTE